MKLRIFFNFFLWSGTFTMLVMSMHYFQNYVTGIIQGKSLSNQLWYHIVFRIHIVFGILAMLAAPTQFSKKLRQRHILLHKTLGYVYVLAVFLSGLSGLIIAQFAMGGLMSRLGFSFLAILWLLFTYKAITTILKKEVKNHQKWMIRSFALTFSAITLRLMLLLPLFFDIEFITIYKLASWSCWIINLGIAELIISRNRI
ncbi:DUF2306 domain-containing protein [Winogradskyella sp.]|uniref:DUF2306 domain-containing protein n=1 Tax=Winogradskyella sp. TaxID=1883156 RepID=UPI00261BB710|nr:DUF2306 domain-containing protein [Winogradskyella sp.]